MYGSSLTCQRVAVQDLGSFEDWLPPVPAGSILPLLASATATAFAALLKSKVRLCTHRRILQLNVLSCIAPADLSYVIAYNVGVAPADLSYVIAYNVGVVQTYTWTCKYVCLYVHACLA